MIVTIQLPDGTHVTGTLSSNVVPEDNTEIRLGSRGKPETGEPAWTFRYTRFRIVSPRRA